MPYEGGIRRVGVIEQTAQSKGDRGTTDAVIQVLLGRSMLPHIDVGEYHGGVSVRSVALGYDEHGAAFECHSRWDIAQGNHASALAREVPHPDKLVVVPGISLTAIAGDPFEIAA